MQHQIERFNKRKLSIVAISVDEIDQSRRVVDRLGLSYALASDPDQQVVQQFGVQNPDTNELAIHAVYLISQQHKIFYRKVGSRRPSSAELIDAVDAFRGEYPQNDGLRTAAERIVAYPSNNFQTLIEMSVASEIPDTVDKSAMIVIANLQGAGNSDDAIIAFRRYVTHSVVPEKDRLTAAAWLARQVFVINKPEAVKAGLDLQRRLRRVAELETLLAEEKQVGADEDAADELLHKLAGARGGLSKARATVVQNATAWNLRYAQGTLRAYREVAREGLN